MKAIVVRPNYELHAERHDAADLVSINIYTVWPHARTDRSPHKILSLNLSNSEMDALADFIRGAR